MLRRTCGRSGAAFFFSDRQPTQWTSIVVTLYAGRVRVRDEPLTAVCPIATGVIGVCPCAVAAVIWNICAVPESGAPVMAVICGVFARLMATRTTRTALVLSLLA